MEQTFKGMQVIVPPLPLCGSGQCYQLLPCPSEEVCTQTCTGRSDSKHSLSLVPLYRWQHSGHVLHLAGFADHYIFEAKYFISLLRD
jgi:hypothetical protein